MRSALLPLRLALALFGLSFSPAGGAQLLRAVKVAESPEEPSDEEHAQQLAGIKEKWDKMDEFLGIMFTLACKWKHDKDLHGYANKTLMDGDLRGTKEYNNFVKDLQAKNTQRLTEACGRIVAGGKHKCRQSCADRWNARLGSRAECDSKCVDTYARFEKDCEAKAENLAIVYSTDRKKTEGKQQCLNGFCAEFPQVWSKDSAEEQTAEVQSLCSSRCSDTNVKRTCDKLWRAEVDLVSANITSSCLEDSTVTECFSGKKVAASSESDSCMSTGSGTCNSQYDECGSKGNVDASDPSAKAFCDDRKKMCEKQVTDGCLKGLTEALEEAKTECESQDAAALKTCKDTKLAEVQTTRDAACLAEQTATCSKDCKGKCDVAGMNGCLSGLVNNQNSTEMFCMDFWRLLHTSSEVDPVTGDPIVLLSS